MLLRFFQTLRDYRVPVSTRELIDLLSALRAGFAFGDIDAFYFLARMTLVKDERFFDRFDRACEFFFAGIGGPEGLFDELLPAEELAEQLLSVSGRRKMSEAQRAELQAAVLAYRAALARQVAGGLEGIDEDDELADTDGDRGTDAKGGERGEKSADASDADGSDAGDEPGASEEPGAGDEGSGGEEGEEGEEGQGEEPGEEGEDGQEGRGERGESPSGSDGEAESGEREEVGKESRKRATRLWEARQFEEWDDDVELGTRAFKIALRRLRRLARQGAEEEFDLRGTIAATANNAGWLDIKWVPERRNTVKVLLLLDIGGSMDEYVQVCEQLFSAAQSEFKYLFTYYFHNFTYEHMWTSAVRTTQTQIATNEIIRTFSSDYKVVFVGDANMGLHEMLEVGGAIEGYNDVPGLEYFKALQAHFRRVVWINPTPNNEWSGVATTNRIRRLLDEKMYPLTVEGVTDAMKELL